MNKRIAIAAYSMFFVIVLIFTLLVSKISTTILYGLYYTDHVREEVVEMVKQECLK